MGKLKKTVTIGFKVDAGVYAIADYIAKSNGFRSAHVFAKAIFLQYMKAKGYIPKS